MNTDSRNKATNEFVRSFYKLMNNAAFGKTMENVRDRSNIKLRNKTADIIKDQSHPHFINWDYVSYDQSLVLMHKKQTQVLLNKPIFVGLAILDLSKCHMANFHYNGIRKVFGPRAKLLMTDTDSLMYEFTSPNVSKELLVLQEEYLDCFKYKPDHILYSIQQGCYRVF